MALTSSPESTNFTDPLIDQHSTRPVTKFHLAAGINRLEKRADWYVKDSLTNSLVNYPTGPETEKQHIVRVGLGIRDLRTSCSINRSWNSVKCAATGCHMTTSVASEKLLQPLVGNVDIKLTVIGYVFALQKILLDCKIKYEVILTLHGP